MELSPNAIDSTRHSSTLHSKTIIFIRWTNKITEPRNAWLKNMRKIQYLNSLLPIHPVLLPEFKFSVNTLPICPAAKLSVHFSVYYLCWCCSCILLQLCVHHEQTSNEQGKRKKKKLTKTSKEVLIQSVDNRQQQYLHFLRRTYDIVEYWFKCSGRRQLRSMRGKDKNCRSHFWITILLPPTACHLQATRQHWSSGTPGATHQWPPFLWFSSIKDI